MSEALLLLPPAIIAAVVIFSGIAKLRQPDDLAGWRDLGVPSALRQPWLLKFHPWGELALGVALLALGGVLGLLAGLAAVGLMLAYLWLVVRAWRRTDDASCSCFGEAAPVTGATVTRNVWLLAVALLALVGLWQGPMLGGVILAATDAAVWPWLVGAAAAAVTAWLITRRVDSESEASAQVEASASHIGDDELDYIRVRTPAVPVTLADGSEVNLRTLTMTRPIMMFAVSATCGACQSVRDKIPEWRTRLPEIELRLLLMDSPENSPWTEWDEPQSVHDPAKYVRDSIEPFGTPSALLFGADGLLAGGPVTGYDAIEGFVSDVRASLDEVTEFADSAGA